jgi:hypothetical protein
MSTVTFFEPDGKTTISIARDLTDLGKAFAVSIHGSVQNVVAPWDLKTPKLTFCALNLDDKGYTRQATTVTRNPIHVVLGVSRDEYNAAVLEQSKGDEGQHFEVDLRPIQTRNGLKKGLTFNL